ncbi:MAG: Nif3-like dinuclear metal center hexameric protein [Bacteroidales bacterium]|nr:Nif3-like dinuclear metal center hexameric protein [Bacteroidales bacterium]MDD4209109.1 Nif3-like dinuclear metal center hexameric protein [Bacteroidales bacterium]
MKISDVIDFLEHIAPPSYQENYDNSGLIVGNVNHILQKGLICLDITENTLSEAISVGANFIVSHHPLIFKSLKSITGKSLVDKLLIQAIKHDITIYAMHTNLDNVYEGVNYCFCKKLALNNLHILHPKNQILRKLITYVPLSYAEKVRNAIFEAGGGHISNYDCCSFNANGIGTFKANDKANPFVGKKNEIHAENETRIEITFPDYLEKQIISTLLKTHPYEEVAYDIYLLENSHPQVGSGIIGTLSVEMHAHDFLNYLKEEIKLTQLKHSKISEKKIKTVAFCGGSGAFLIQDAIAQKANVFITGEINYHDFINYGDDILIIAIGHYESEIEIKHYLYDKLIKKFSTFAVSKSETNPIYYL